MGRRNQHKLLAHRGIAGICRVGLYWMPCHQKVLSTCLQNYRMGVPRCGGGVFSSVAVCNQTRGRLRAAVFMANVPVFGNTCRRNSNACIAWRKKRHAVQRKIPHLCRSVHCIVFCTFLHKVFLVAAGRFGNFCKFVAFGTVFLHVRHTPWTYRRHSVRIFAVHSVAAIL